MKERAPAIDAGDPINLALGPLATFLEHTPSVAIQLYNAAGRVLLWNHASEELYGFSAQEAVGKKLQEFLLPPDEVPAFERTVQRIIDTRIAAEPTEWVVERKDKERRTVYSSMFPVQLEGMPTLVACMDVDLTDLREAERELRSSQAQLAASQRIARLGSWEWHFRSNVVIWSDELFRIFGVDPKECCSTYQEYLERVHPDDRTRVRDAIESAIRNGRSFEFEHRIVRGNGAVRVLQCRGEISMDHGVADCLLGTAQDVTERQQMAEALQASEERHRLLAESLRASEQRYRLLFQRNLAGVYRTTLEGKLLECNEAFAHIFGYDTVEELFEHGILPLYFEPDEREKLIERLKQERVLSNVEARLRRKNGSVVWVLENVSLIEGDEHSPPHLEGTIIDITDRKLAEEQILHQAYHDALTGLPNRALLKDRLSTALEHVRRNRLPLAVIFLDVDHFKLINDTLGHNIGDALLVAVGERLRGCVRAEDTVARVGGDEFTLLLPSIADAEDAVHVARKILETVSRPFEVQGHELFVTVSAGIALHPTDGENADMLLKSADAAMYRAKDLGRNTYQTVTRATSVRSLERLAMENALRHALEREEFDLFYQPILNVRKDSISGLEVLLRWRHPDRGLLLPGDFIALAEDTRLIVPIGEWVLRAACRQVRAWREQGYEGTRIAVNLSMRQFQQPDLPRLVESALAESTIAPECLDLEITESTAMQNADATISTLRELDEMGVRISIDDFGTGYSSLNYLKQFPIDALKIDRSFIADLPRARSDRAIVAAVVAVARALEVRVIAEGVERQEQAWLLRDLGCDELQGFLLSTPVPAGSIERFLRRSH